MNKKLRTLLALVLTALLAMSLSACGGGGKNDVTEGPLTTDSTVVNVERVYRVTADVPPLCALIIKKSAKKSDKGRGSGKSGASGKGRKNDNV